MQATNFVEVLSKKGRKTDAKKVKTDDLDLAMEAIEAENRATLNKIKEHMAAQLSDSEGCDAVRLSTPELLKKCNSVITKDNPTGQPPGVIQQGPIMLNLLTRYHLSNQSRRIDNGFIVDSPGTHSVFLNTPSGERKLPEYAYSQITTNLKPCY